jgi:hypothetical protein
MRRVLPTSSLTEARPPAIKAVRYIGLDEIRTLLLSGDIVLVKASYLLELAKTPGAILPMRQDLPRRAVCDEATLHLYFDEMQRWINYCEKPGAMSFAMRQTPIVAISYAWASKQHPDPEGWMLREVLARVCEWYMSERAYLIHCEEDYYASGGRTAPRILPEVGSDFGVFLDYTSIYQNTHGARTEAQTASFRRALHQMDLIYAHQQTCVWRLTASPPGVGSDYLPYVDRGWPFFETTASQAIKPSKHCLSFGTDDAVSALAHFDGSLKPDSILMRKGSYGNQFISGPLRFFTGSRVPPLVPEEFAPCLSTKTFTNGADHTVVIALQKALIMAVLREAKELDYARLNWGPKETPILVKAISECPQLCSLNLFKNSFSHVCMEQLCGALVRNLQLNKLDLRFNGFGAQGIAAVMTLSICCPISELRLSGNKLGAEGLGLLAVGLKGSRASATLCLLSLEMNHLGPEGVTQHLPSLFTHATNLKTLTIYLNDLGPEGGKALATAMPTARSLETLDARLNDFGDEGGVAVAKALATHPTLTSAHVSLNDFQSEDAKSAARELLNARLAHSSAPLMSLDLDAHAPGPTPEAALVLEGDPKAMPRQPKGDANGRK